MSRRAVAWTMLPLRTCQTLHHCQLCDTSITLGQSYFDGGEPRRAHAECVPGWETTGQYLARKAAHDQHNQEA